MSMTIIVRPVEPGDLIRVGELTAHAYLADGLISEQDDYFQELRDARRRADEAKVLVAVEDEHVVGTITLAGHGSPYAEIAGPGELEIRMLAVDPAFRGKGVGEKLVRAGLALGLAEGARSIILSTMPGMRTARRMYERIGLYRAAERDWPIGGQTMLVFSTSRGPTDDD